MAFTEGGGYGSGSYTEGFNSGGSVGGVSGPLKSQQFNVYQPEQWDAWRKLQTGAAYSDELKNAYLENTIRAPGRESIAMQQNVANNSYGPGSMFGSYAKMANANAVRKGQQDMMNAESTFGINWEKLKNQTMMEALNQRPMETKIYRDYPGMSSSASSRGGFNTVAARPDVKMWDLSGIYDKPAQTGVQSYMYGGYNPQDELDAINARLNAPRTYASYGGETQPIVENRLNSSGYGSFSGGDSEAVNQNLLDFIQREVVQKAGPYTPAEEDYSDLWY